MSKPVQDNKRISRKETENRIKRWSPINFLLKPVGIAFTIIFYVFISIVVGTLIEWVGITFWWEGDHAAKILQTEFAYLGDNFSTTIFGGSAESIATKVITGLNSHLFAPVFQPNPSTTMLVIDWLRSLGEGIAGYVNAFLYIVMITAIRCIIIILSSVLFVLVAIAAATDGLREREMRRLGGGYEHGDVYHWAKTWAPRIIYVSPVLYLAWPTAINPNFIMLPGLFAFFVVVYLFFSKYKKVL